MALDSKSTKENKSIANGKNFTSKKCLKKMNKDCKIYFELNKKQLNGYFGKPKPIPDIKKVTRVIECKPKRLKRYYQPGLVAKIDRETRYEDVDKLVEHGVRTFLVQLGFATKDELDQIMLKITDTIENAKMKSKYRTPVGLAVEMRGEVVRTGRLRNNREQDIEVGDLICLTTDQDYKYVSVKEVIYVHNLSVFMGSFKIGDVIFMDNCKIQLQVVKIWTNILTTCVERGEKVKSYMRVDLPYSLKGKYKPSDNDIEDIEFAWNHGAHFLVIPSVRSSSWLETFKKYIEKSGKNLEIAACMQKCGRRKLSELKQIVQLCDVLWMPDFFVKEHNPLRFTVKSSTAAVVKIAKYFRKPIIVTIPIKTRKDFNKLENHEMLRQIDSMLIEKSEITKTFPIIAKNLEPLSKTDLWTGEAGALCSTSSASQPDNYQGLANCINYTIHNIDCQGIVVHSNANTFTYLSSGEIYCPVIAVVDDERSAKSLNIRRNIKTVVFQSSKEDEDDCKKETDFINHGIDYGKYMKLFWEGDFVITFCDAVCSEQSTSKITTVYIPKEKIRIKQSRLGNFREKQCRTGSVPELTC